jgi:hypothetical protein
MAMALLLMAVAVSLAKADSTGDLSFLCRGGCSNTVNSQGYLGTAPSGSFTYANGDLTLTEMWDNVQWTFDLGSFSQDYYLSLTGQSDYKTVWVAECLVGSGDAPGGCGDNGVFFYIFQVRGCLDPTCDVFSNSLATSSDTRDQIDFTSASGIGSMLPDAASGTMAADIFSTPEPSALSLLALGAIALRATKKQGRKKSETSLDAYRQNLV